MTCYTLTGILAGMLPKEGPALLEDGQAQRVGEDRLSQLWYSGAFSHRGLLTRCGRRVRVFYRGLPNGDRGPDYLGAVLSLGRGKPRSGDIELHVRTSQWRAHGHHLDAHYDGVILHVVWEDDDTRPTLLPSGRQAPVLALGSLPYGAGEASCSGEPCRTSPRDQDRLRDALDRAGEERFLGKAAGLEGDMAVFPPQEVLYQTLAQALGYSRNQGPFRRLAVLLPLAVVEGFLWGQGLERREAMAQALLLGTAGFLPSQRGSESSDGWPGFLEELWRACALGQHLDLREWSLGVRPENHPARRLAGLSSIIVESLEEGLVEWAVSGFRVKGQGSRDQGLGFGVQGLVFGPPVVPGPGTVSIGSRAESQGAVVSICGPRLPDPGPLTLDPILGRLRRVAAGYWRDHYDLGRPGERLGHSLVGWQRALEIAANVLLPFAYAYGERQGDRGMSRAAMETFRLLPSPGSNQVTRHMAGQVLGAARPRLAGTARRQQGLMHLFRAYCTRGRCGACPLGGP